MKNFSIWILLMIFFAAGSFAYAPARHIGNDASVFVQHLVSADSAYALGNYRLAATTFGYISKKFPNKNTPHILFKYAYSLYKIDDYEQSISWFDQALSQDNSYLPVYAAYFKIRALQHIKEDVAAEQGNAFIQQYPKTSLADSLILPTASYFYTHGEIYSAEQLYLKFKKWHARAPQSAFVAARLVKIRYALDKKEQARKEALRAMDLYPGAPETLNMVRYIKENDLGFYNNHFFKIGGVFYANRLFKTLKSRLEQYVRREKDATLKQKARYNLIRIYFAQQKYTTALFGFRSMLTTVKKKSLEAKIRLYIARIYLKKGLRQKAIKAYRDYAHRFPGYKLASEAVWKSAWISEGLQDLKQALENYHYLREKWPASRYAREAYFREGFTHYRLGNVSFAETIFRTLFKKRAPDVEKNRAQYWLALCSEAQGDFKTADSLRLQLSHHLWDDYYTMKSYLLHKSTVDSGTQIIQSFKENAGMLTYYASGFSSLTTKLKTAFDVRDVLGQGYAVAALEDVKLYAKTREEWITLAEIFKKFKAYGKAYRTYDHINRKFYAGLSYSQKPFMVKERFPYYYDREVNTYAERNKIEAEFILAVMKQESVFNFKAHSLAQAFGLMQLLPKTAKAMARHDKLNFSSNGQLFNPETNIRLGAYYLKKLLKQFDNKKELVLAAYNAGPHRVKKWRTFPGSEQMDVFIENIEFKETRNYVRKVMKNYWAYKLLRHDFQVSANDLQIGWNE